MCVHPNMPRNQAKMLLRAAYRYEEDLHSLVLCVHGSNAHALLTGLVHLHLRPQLSVQNQPQTSLGAHHCLIIIGGGGEKKVRIYSVKSNISVTKRNEYNKNMHPF